MMKKSEKISLISALSAVATMTAHEYLLKKKVLPAKLKAFYTVTPVSLLSAILASRMLSDDQPVSQQDYISSIAQKNVQKK
jgi:hypothetical protein